MIISQCAESTPTFGIIDTKLCVLIVTLSTKDNVKLAKQLSDGFEHSVYWNKYTLISNEEVTLNTNGIGNIKKPLDSIFQEVKILFVIAYYHSISANSTDADDRVKVDSC